MNEFVRSSSLLYCTFTIVGPLYSSRTDDAVNERLVNFESADNIDDDGYYYYYSDKKPLSISYRLKRIVSFDPFDATVGVYICFA